MSTLAVVIACWLGIDLAFVALRLYHTWSYIHAVDTSPELVEHTQLSFAFLEEMQDQGEVTA
jgi:hypothetical protein